MNEELVSLIVKELRRHRERKVIIEKVCASGGLNWKQAEQLILLLEAQQKRTIAVQRTPLLLFLSIGGLLLGIGLLASNSLYLLGSVSGPDGNSYRVIEMMVGVGVTILGMIGLRKAFRLIFPD